jgi:nucleoside-diphosphate-sugar epimerase
MRILLIGGNGFIGRFVAPALQRQGHELAILHRGTFPVPEGIEEICGDRNELIASAEDLKRFNPENVIDFVISSGSQAQQLIDVFRGTAQRVIMLSSIDVYRAIGISHGTESGPLQELPLTEDSELRRNLQPYSPESLKMMRTVFSWATNDYDKIPAERIVMAERDPAGTVLRLPMVYGPGDPLHRFYAVAKRIADDRRHIILPEILAAWHSPRGYVENVAHAIALAATDQRAAGRIYNVCEEPSFSELEWARKIAEAMQWKGDFVVLPDDRTPRHLVRPGNAAQHWSASSVRIRAELGYHEPVSIDEAIRRTIAWELQNAPSLAGLVQFDYGAEDKVMEDLTS